ncbi:MAG TPA: LemA family protein [Terriglobia bacterium]
MAWVFLAILVGVILWAIFLYNGLVTLRNQVTNGWKQIDVQLKRRHDLIPNLVSTVKGIMQFEQETLQKVVEARSAAMGARGVKDAAAKESALTDALSKFFVVVEQYPQLRSSENVGKLQEELTSTENKIHRGAGCEACRGRRRCGGHRSASGECRQPVGAGAPRCARATPFQERLGPRPFQTTFCQIVSSAA